MNTTDRQRERAGVVRGIHRIADLQNRADAGIGGGEHHRDPIIVVRDRSGLQGRTVKEWDERYRGGGMSERGKFKRELISAGVREVKIDS